MTRPRKLALEGVALVARSSLNPGGELAKLRDTLPEHERSHFVAAVEGLINSTMSRAERTPATPIPDLKPKPKPAIALVTNETGEQ